MADTIPSDQTQVPLPTTYRLPADYYSAPAADVRPIFPRWVPAGCGWASLVFLIVLFTGGAFVARAGMGTMMDFVLGMMETEILRMYAADVTKEQKESLSRELTRLRENVRTERVPIQSLDPVMKSLRKASADEKLTAGEVESLVRDMKKLNEGRRPSDVSRQKKSSDL